MSTATLKNGGSQFFPLYGYAGLVLVGICWSLSWSLEGVRTHLLFFPQWLGYCLVVEALVQLRTGTSLMARSRKWYAALFLLSVPVWWLFEGLNQFTQNWIYLGREHFSDWAYFLYASMCFSTVIPAVFSTAELVASFRWTCSLKRWRGFRLDRCGLWLLHAAGWGMLLLMIVFPELFFPLLWLSVFFILDPLNALRGRLSLIRIAASGELRPLVILGAGALVCGFFWELWNLYAYPKWIYDIPYLEVMHVFEMPLAGYGGYIPFSWELFALVAAVARPGLTFVDATAQSGRAGSVGSKK
ncbi:MAG TPA: hypothetical protein VJ960_06275 [Oceanipulchritudo sp.]|nr:hypothetical protein [Oceanipulchritudo sp.]